MISSTEEALFMFNGRIYRSIEHAYRTWSGDEFNYTEYSKGSRKSYSSSKIDDKLGNYELLRVFITLAILSNPRIMARLESPVIEVEGPEVYAAALSDSLLLLQNRSGITGALQ